MSETVSIERLREAYVRYEQICATDFKEDQLDAAYREAVSLARHGFHALPALLDRLEAAERARDEAAVFIESFIGARFEFDSRTHIMEQVRGWQDKAADLILDKLTASEDAT
jgi:hypothetical protein